MNRTRTGRRVGGVVVALGLVAAGLAAGAGCVRQIQWLPQVGEVPISGLDQMGNWEGAPALDIQNHRGSVTVVVSPNVAAPRVTALAHVSGRVDPEVAWTAAAMEMDNGRPVLRVLSSPQETGAPEAPVDIRVIVPSCGGVRVRNDGGPVTLLDVSGAIEVHTGLAGGAGRAIFIETASPLDAPMLLRSERGDVEVRMGTGGGGRLNATTREGRVTVDAGNAKVRDVRGTGKAWAGTINDGESDQRIDVERGDVRVYFSMRAPVRQPDAPWLAPD